MKLSDRRKNKKYLENLNKRDIHQFRKFLEQVKKGTGDEYFDKCLPLLVKYIENFYTSDENKTFDLNDYIQECMIKISETEDDEVFSLAWTLTQSFKKIYESMSQSTDYDFVEPVELDKEYDEIDISSIDYDIMFDNIREQLEFERHKKVLDCIRKDMDVKDMAQEIGVSKQNAYGYKNRVLRIIARSDEYKELTKDNKTDYFTGYRVFLMKMVRLEGDNCLEKILKTFWKGRIDTKNYPLYCEQMIYLLDFFYKLRSKCDNPRYSFYYDNINEDIQSILFSFDESKMLEEQKEKVELLIDENEEVDSKRK